jgi:preprotein translocase subunit SecG
MLQIFWLSVSFFTVVLILIRVPNSDGVGGAATKNNVPSPREKILNSIIWYCFGIYVLLAIKFNLK